MSQTETVAEAEARAAELRRAFAEVTTKLGVIASALGLNGDESLAVIRERTRRHVQCYAKITHAANEVLLSTAESLGQCHVRPAAIAHLREAVAFTQGL